MSFRNWLFIAAAVGLGTASLGQVQEQTGDPTVENQPVPQQRDKESPSASEQDTAPDQEPATVLIPGLEDIESAIRDLETVIGKPTGQEEEEQSRRDLTAQEDMAKWAKFMFYASAASVVLTGLGVWLIWGTLRHTAAIAHDTTDTAKAAVATAEHAKAANEVAKANVMVAERALSMGSRPWLSASLHHAGDAAFHRIGDGDIATLLEIRIKNHGTYPGMYTVVVDSVSADTNLPIIEPQMGSAESVRKTFFKHPKTVIFPNQELRLQPLLTNPPAAISAFKLPPQEGAPERVRVRAGFMCTVLYSSVGGREMFETGFQGDWSAQVPKTTWDVPGWKHDFHVYRSHWDDFAT